MCLRSAVLREIQKHTPNTGDDAKRIGSAVQQIKDVATHLNERQRQIENMNNIVQLQQTTKNIDWKQVQVSMYPAIRRLSD